MIRKITLVSLILILLLPFSQVMAITSQQLQSIYGDSEYYIPGGICGGATDVTLTGSDNEQEAYNFFIQNGLNAIQASAVVGNLYDESHVDPTDNQGGPETDDPSNLTEGWGIAQWTPGSKILQIAQTFKVTAPIYELATQLNIVWDEMGPNGEGITGVHDWVQQLEQTTDLDQATQYVEAELEEGSIAYADGLNPTTSSASDGYLLNRENDANSIYKLYGSSSGNSGSTLSSTSQACPSAAVSCNTGTSTTTQTSTSNSSSVSNIRQNVVCLAQNELALWESQPNYNSPYPDYTYAATGFLKYSDNIYEEWCADFVSWIYNQAGYPFSGGEDGGWMLSGVVGIQSLASENQAFQWHPKSTSYVPQPGDIALYYDPTQTNPWVHTNIFISSTGGVSTYIGGDQGGVDQPDGTYGTQSPPSGSVVSMVTSDGYYSNGIAGYVSPN